MRKVVIAAAVALVLFAVGAFAASFLVSSEDIASGTDDVVACADAVDVDFTTVYDPEVNDWTVDTVELTFSSAGCDGFDATVVVATTDSEGVETDPAAEGTGAVSGTTASISIDPVLASQVSSASVLVEGQVVTTTPTTVGT